jgi:anti-sigma B factor antagonist
MDERPPFEVELLRPSDDVAVVELQGEVDINAARQFEEALSRGIRGGATRVIIDFAKVSFVDSTALGVVVGGVKTTKAQGGTLSIVCCEENIRGIFETTRLDQILGIYRSRAEALAAGRP